jgi:K+ transporter
LYRCGRFARAFYVGFVNWTLMVLTLALTISFRSSDYLASAFGIAGAHSRKVGRDGRP